MTRAQRDVRAMMGASVSYLVEGEQQLLLELWTHGRHLGVQALQPVHQQARAEAGAAHLRAGEEEEEEEEEAWGAYGPVSGTL